MAKSNAQRQAEWRKRHRAEINTRRRGERAATRPVTPSVTPADPVEAWLRAEYEARLAFERTGLEHGEDITEALECASVIDCDWTDDRVSPEPIPGTEYTITFDEWKRAVLATASENTARRIAREREREAKAARAEAKQARKAKRELAAMLS